MRCLTRPRYMKTCLPEFMQRDGKDAFVKKHPLPPYEKVCRAETSLAEDRLEPKFSSLN